MVFDGFRQLGKVLPVERGEVIRHAPTLLVAHWPEQQGRGLSMDFVCLVFAEVGAHGFFHGLNFTTPDQTIPTPVFARQVALGFIPAHCLAHAFEEARRPTGGVFQPIQYPLIELLAALEGE
ncbi:hypothetical protein D3C73_1243870 [compost metagenome]